MTSIIQKLKLNIFVPAVLCIIIGILLVAYPEDILLSISKLIAAIIVVMGVFLALFQFMDNKNNIYGIAVGVIITLVGVWLIIKPDLVVTFIPIVVGVILVSRGVHDISLGLATKHLKGKGMALAIIVALIDIVCGAYCICAAFSIVKIVTIVMGIMFIIDGITDLFVGANLYKAQKFYDEQANAIIVESSCVDEVVDSTESQ